MALPSTATLAYSAALGGPTSNAQKQTAMAAVQLYNPSALPCSTDPVIAGLFGSVVTSDVTAASGSNMVRTIIITLGPAFFTLFPTVSDWTHSLDNYYTYTLALGLAAHITAAPVVFA